MVLRNATSAMLAHLAKRKVCVQYARMVFIKTTKGEQNVSNATLENCTSIPKQLAVLVALVDLAAAKVFVQLARMVFIKTTKAKQNASNAHWVNRTSIPKQHAVIVTLVRLAAVTVIVQLARLDSIKIPKEKKSAGIPVTCWKKYPTKKAPGVNCHRGVPAKWANI